MTFKFCCLETPNNHILWRRSIKHSPRQGVGVRRWCFPFLCVWQILRCAALRQKKKTHLFFHAYHSPSGCPFDRLLYPPHCALVCALHVALAYGLPAIIHFLYLWSNGGGEAGAQKVYQYHWSVFRYDTETSPSWLQRSHHTVQLTSCVAAWCRRQVNKLSIHTLHTVHPHTRSSAWDHRHPKGCRHVDVNSQGGEFLHTLSVIRPYLIQLNMMKHFTYKIGVHIIDSPYNTPHSHSGHVPMSLWVRSWNASVML